LRLHQHRYWKLFLWIPDQVGNDKQGKKLQALLEAFLFSLSLSGLTRQSRDFGHSRQEGFIILTIHNPAGALTPEQS
jgi:hypothetical protein